MSYNRYCHCRENQLALQLMCKQYKRKEFISVVKSLPLLQRELEHLEDYFVYKQEIDSDENCIVLTFSLGKLFKSLKNLCNSLSAVNYICDQICKRDLTHSSNLQTSTIHNFRCVKLWTFKLYSLEYYCSVRSGESFKLVSFLNIELWSF